MSEVLITFKNPYPDDYIAQMDIFSRVELKAYNNNPDDKIFRDLLLKKRSEFNYYKFIKRKGYYNKTR